MATRKTPTKDHLRKAGARMARTGGGTDVARAWCRSNELTAQQARWVMTGHRDEIGTNPLGIAGRRLLKREGR